MAARGGTDPCRLLPPSAAPLPPYIPRHAFSDLPGNLGSAPNCRAQRLRHDPRARRRDAAVRVRRGHPAPDDALRGELCVVGDLDRKSTRLNSSHVAISYAVFCLKKKKNKTKTNKAT